MRIELVIDELVLIGFDARDRHRIADALVRELSGQLTPATVERLLNHEGDLSHLRATADGPVSSSTPDAIGAAVSRSLVDAMAGEGRS